jgi:hypothetical protein
LQLVSIELYIAKDLREQSGADGFTRVHRHNSDSAIGVPEKVVAALDPRHPEARATESREQLLAATAGYDVTR